MLDSHTPLIQRATCCNHSSQFMENFYVWKNYHCPFYSFMVNPGSIPGLGRSPGEGNGYPLQHSCLENFMDRGAWQATVHGIAESDMTEWLTTFKPFMGHHWLNEWLYFSPHYFFRITSFLENEIVTHKTNLPIVINRMSFYLPRYIKR